MTVHHGKLHHKTPGWVESGARFHIRVSIEGVQRQLTDSAVAGALLESADFYHQKDRWYAWLFLLMPNHLHAVLSFPPSESMSAVVGDWKRYQEHTLNIVWQEGYFDHRLRNDAEFMEKCHYIRMNPVRAGLCAISGEWKWLSEPWRQERA